MRTMMVVMVLAIAGTARAQAAEPELAADEERLALAVAQVCANERSLGAAQPADCALIWQTVRRHGETTEERLAWLTRHSRCVLDLAYEPTERELAGNCRWSRYLAASDDEPAGWNEGLWSRYIARWATMRRFCRSLVAGRRPRGGWPCSRDPDTWGGEMDRARALRAGLVPLGCEGTANEGYRFGPVAPRD